MSRWEQLISARPAEAQPPRGDDRPVEQVAGMRGHTDVVGELDVLTGGDDGDQVAEAPQALEGRSGANAAG